ncbi:amino acid adenylation domain-containing protein [Corallococcus llansteffanensis]|nr:amino acid adenylation domain-containing protein [Corallococcus llansteffanensis]
MTRIETQKTLADILETGLRAHPDRIAVDALQRSLTFAELDALSGALAQQFQQRWDVRRGDRVVVLAQKSLEIVAAAIAIWRAGAVYVPIDVQNPAKRTEYILQSVKPKLVISSQAALDRFAQVLGDLPTLSYEAISALPRHAGAPVDPPVGLEGDDDCMIIHTSGSTGHPKGAVLQHRSTLVYFHNHNEYLGFGQDSRGMNNGPFHFDVAIQDTFLPLYFGATVLLHGDLFLSRVMASLIEKKEITHLIAVSSVLDLISKDEACMEGLRHSRLQVLVTGGELCDPKLINRWLTLKPDLKVLYGYGPTECNSLCTTYVVRQPDPQRTRPYPIGKPFTGMKAVLLDEDRQVIHAPQTTGVLAMAGPQLMKGYWDLPEETQKALIEFEGERFYVTGDRCHWDEEGNLHFDGRNDTEVKLRGRRINLNEIRDALLAHPQVRYAVVNTVVQDGVAELFSFVYSDPPATPTHAELEAWLKERVPGYMMPRYICLANGLPRTSTAKVSERDIVSSVVGVIAKDPSKTHLVLDAQGGFDNPIQVR